MPESNSKIEVQDSNFCNFNFLNISKIKLPKFGMFWKSTFLMWPYQNLIWSKIVYLIKFEVIKSRRFYGRSHKIDVIKESIFDAVKIAVSVPKSFFCTQVVARIPIARSACSWAILRRNARWSSTKSWPGMSQKSMHFSPGTEFGFWTNRSRVLASEISLSGSSQTANLLSEIGLA